ncbi:MAG: choice-of-anchor D domain-containing protein [Bacteroidetes bacterium]|nr:choice-of-anchor D domain-containing protein [Bacteroidota bacterium]
MKKLVILCCLFQFITLTLVGQTLSVFDVDISKFPIMKAKFFAFDKDGKQITNLSPSDFTLTEDGIQRTVTKVFCSSPKPDVSISSVLTLDVSGFMKDSILKMAQNGANKWVNLLNFSSSECALTAFSDESYFINDFTTNKQRLLDKIAFIRSFCGVDKFCRANYNEAFLNPNNGAINVVANGKNKRVIIFLTNGKPSFEPQTDRIIQLCQQNQITVFSIVVNMDAPTCLKEISLHTGGEWFDNVTTEEKCKEIFLRVFQLAQNVKPCEIEWLSDENCVTNRSCISTLIPQSAQTKFSYFISINNIAKIEYNPSTIIKFDTIIPSKSQIKEILITARKRDLLIKNYKTNNPDFQIIDWGGSTPPFILQENQSRTLKVQFTPSNNVFAFSCFEIESDACIGNKFYARTCIFYDTTVNKVFKLTKPNGGESFVQGSDTTITWEGVLPGDSLTIDFSIDKGINWKNLTNGASNLKYKWNNIPSPISKQCIMKVKSKEIPIAYGSLIHTFRGHNGFVSSVAFSPDGTKLASGSNDETVKLWDIITGDQVKSLTGHTDVIRCVAYSPDNTMFASASEYYDKTIKLWDVNSGSEIKTLIGHTETIYSIAFSPNSTFLASGSEDRTIKLWNLTTGDVIKSFSGQAEGITSIAYSPDGTKLVSGSFDHTIKIWDINSGNLINTFLGHLVVVGSVIFSADGKLLASCSGDSTIKIWDFNSGTIIKTLTGKNFRPSSIAFNPNGSKLASGNSDSTIKIWDLNSGTIIKTLTGHTGRIRTVAFSPDGLFLASGSNDSTIKIWAMDNVSIAQQDISDSLWSIVAPQAGAVDIDMKQALVGTMKDSVITGFITNTGSYPCRIDSIYFEGGDNNQFAQVSGFPPFTVDVGNTKSVEFRFKPNSVGNKSSTIVIITQADTLRQRIIGEGVLPQLLVMTNILDFGKVELGNEKTFSDTLLLKNIGTSPIAITNTELMYPDKEQFNIISGGGAFNLNSGDSRPLTVQFKPKYGGRTSGGIGFDYSGAGSPAIVTLFGEGIGGLVTIPDDSAKPGETRELKLNFSKVKMDGIQAIATNFKSKVRFQRSILAPLDRKSISTFSNDSVIIDVTGEISNNTELASIPVVAALGTTTETTLDLLEFNLYDDSDNIVDYDIETRSGKFKILGICEEGGKRLLDMSEKVQMLLINPNPASDEAEIEFELIENDRTQLIITNILGEMVLTLFDGIPESGRKKIIFNTNDLIQGNYYVILKTPTIIKTQRVCIVK